MSNFGAAASKYCLSIVSLGHFGRSVASALRNYFEVVDDICLTSTNTNQIDAIRPSQARILILSQPAPTLCAYVSDISFRQLSLMIPLVLDSSRMRMGPIIVPGTSGCWRCWERREQQHSVAKKERITRNNYYDAHSLDRRYGYLEAHALIAAAMIARMIGLSGPDEQCGGSIWEMNVLNGEISTGMLVGIDDCEVCGMGRTDDDRTFASIRRDPDLGRLWIQKVDASGSDYE